MLMAMEAKDFISKLPSHHLQSQIEPRHCLFSKIKQCVLGMHNIYWACRGGNSAWAHRVKGHNNEKICTPCSLSTRLVLVPVNAHQMAPS